MGFGFGNGKRKLRPIGRNGVRPIDRPRRAVGDGVRAIDSPIKPIGRKVKGTSGTGGRVGTRVKPIDKPIKNIFDPLS